MGNRPLAPSAKQENKEPKGKQVGDRVGDTQAALWWQTGRQMRKGVFGAWQMQGLIAGTSHRAHPGSSSGDAGGNWACAIHSLPGSPKFPELQAGLLWTAVGPHSASLGTSEASARQMGHVRLAFNHLSTHLAWNSWLQGRTRSSCRASKSLKQTTHNVCSD